MSSPFRRASPSPTTLARGLIARTGAARDPLALADVTLYLPTRRAARTLNEIVRPHSGRRGAAAHHAAAGRRGGGGLSVRRWCGGADPASAPYRHFAVCLLLATLVQRWDRDRRDGGLTFAQAVALSRALAHFLDETETQGIDLAKLDTLAPETVCAALGRGDRTSSSGARSLAELLADGRQDEPGGAARSGASRAGESGFRKTRRRI